MKYNVTFVTNVYNQVQITANSKEEAEEKAWDKYRKELVSEDVFGDTDIDNVEELK